MYQQVLQVFARDRFGNAVEAAPAFDFLGNKTAVQVITNVTRLHTDVLYIAPQPGALYIGINSTSGGA